MTDSPFNGQEPLANPLYGESSQASLSNVNPAISESPARPPPRPSPLSTLQSAPPVPQGQRSSSLRDSASQHRGSSGGGVLGRLLTTGTFKKKATAGQFDTMVSEVSATKGTKVEHLIRIRDDPTSTPEERSLARKLIEADVDHDGRISTREMFKKMTEVLHEVKMDVTDLQRVAGKHHYTKQLAEKLQSLDVDKDGTINSEELVKGIVELIDSEKEKKMWRWFALAAGLLCFMTVAVIIGLSVALNEAYKDSKVDSSSSSPVLMGYKGSARNVPIQTASVEFSVSNGDLVSRAGGTTVQVATKLSSTTECFVNMDLEYLKTIQLVEFLVDAAQNTTLYLKPLGFLLNTKSITFFTEQGTLTFGDYCHTLSGEVVDRLISQGIMKGPSNGRKVLQMPPSGSSHTSTYSGGLLGRR